MFIRRKRPLGLPERINLPDGIAVEIDYSRSWFSDRVTIHATAKRGRATGYGSHRDVIVASELAVADLRKRLGFDHALRQPA